MSIPEARRRKQLEDESVRLERLVADQALDNSILRDLLERYS
jgi:putative transposase